MKVEIWSDVICPWCYIGKRRFEMALADFPHREDVRIIWRSFELDAASPPQYQGTLTDLLANKYGVSQQQAAAMNARVALLAEEVGLEYHLDKARPGNTLDAHRLLHFAASRQSGNQATERVMRAYFCEGLAVGNRMSLVRLAPELGISESDAMAMLGGDAYTSQVRSDEARAAKLGITGVPFFLVDEKMAISGAQPVGVFADVLRQCHV